MRPLKEQILRHVPVINRTRGGAVSQFEIPSSNWSSV
jgi:hypothetical protein